MTWKIYGEYASAPHLPVEVGEAKGEGLETLIVTGPGNRALAVRIELRDGALRVAVEEDGYLLGGPFGSVLPIDRKAMEATR